MSDTFWRPLPKTHLELQNKLWPGEVHGVEGDCPNPYCDYKLTSQDISDAEWAGGNFTCPNCGWKWNIGTEMWDDTNRTQTRSGMSLTEMGKLGEEVVKQYAKEMNGLPGLGQLLWESPTYNDPIDLVAGDYALEVKSLHSESFPRFKIAADPGQINDEGNKMTRSEVIRKKHERMQELSTHLERPLSPGVLGVRLNFYTNRADFFFAPEYKDRMMSAMQHVGYTDFSSLNPFKRPEDVQKSTLPAQGETVGDDSDIPF